MSDELKPVLSPDQQQEFNEAAKVLIKYLCENHNPHTIIVVKPTGAEILEGIHTTGPVTEFIKD